MSFWVGFLAFLWPKVMKNHGVPEICVFLHPETLEFHVVGELSCWGRKLEIVLNFIPFCYWKGAKFVGKIYIFLAILTCVATLCLNLFCAGGRAESALVLSFYVRF